MSTVTTVSSAALHLIEPNNNQMSSVVVTSVMTGDNVSELLLKDKFNNSSIANMPAAFKYAKDHYTLALPTGRTTQLNNPTKETIALDIADDISYSNGVLVSSFQYVEYQPYMEILDFLVLNRELDITTWKMYKYGTLDFTHGQELIVNSSYISVDGLSVNMFYEYWGYVTRSYTDDSGTTDIVTWEKISEHSEVVPRLSIINNTYLDNTLIALYQKLTNTGAVLTPMYYWIYRISTNKYPELDNNITTTISDEYLPVIPLRYNNQDLTGQSLIQLQDENALLVNQVLDARAAYDAAYATDGGLFTADENGIYTVPPASWYLKQNLDELEQRKANVDAGITYMSAYKETDLYKTSKRLLDILKMPIDKLGEHINKSPDLVHIDHAYVMFGADIQTTDMATIGYLNIYFDYLKTLNTTIYHSTTMTSYGAFGTIPYENSIFTEHGLNLSVSFSTITSELIEGVIDNGKLYNASKVISYIDHPATYDNEGSVLTREYTSTSLVLDYQIAIGVIRRVTVNDLVVTNYVDGNYRVTTTLKTIKDDPSNHNMILPLEYNMTLALKPLQRNKLYMDCTLLVINSVEKTKLKWYQETWFSIVITIVAFVLFVVVTVFSVGTLSAEYAIAYESAYAAAIASGATVADAAAIAASVATMSVIVTAAIGAAIGLTISYAAKLLVRTVGGTIGAVLATVAAIAAIYYTGDLTATVKIMAKYTISYAQLALQCAQAVLSAVNEFIKIGTQKVVKKYEEFQALLKEAYDALDTNSEVQALDNRADFDPLVFVKAKRYYNIPNERPDEFFKRTLDLPNNTFYGVHDAVPNFVSRLLDINLHTVQI